MGKPERRNQGLSGTTPVPGGDPAPQQPEAPGLVEHTAQEQQAVALIQQGNLQQAEAIYRDLIAAGSRSPAVYGNLAAFCNMQGKAEEAIDLLHRSLEYQPDQHESHYNLALAFKARGDLPAAVASYNKALALKANDPDALYGLGITLQELGDNRAAATQLRQAVVINPSHHGAHYCLGNSLLEQGDLHGAIDCYRKTIELRPDFWNAHNNLAFALQEAGEISAALNTCRKALTLRPDDAGLITNLAMLELLAGNYEDGLTHYEHRLQAAVARGTLSAIPSCRRWESGTLERDTRLLLVSEQGAGDTMQFMRYAAVLRQQGIRVSLCAPANLHTLIQGSGIDPTPLRPEQAGLITEGYWAPLQSVAYHLKVRPENPIVTKPYLKSTEALISKWKDNLAAETRPIIGLNWQGDPKHEQANLKGRSLALEAFAPILGQAPGSLLSLQKGFGSEQLEGCSFRSRFVSCQHQVDATWDFLETAAIIANCDLVITSDTAVAHLAAGLGQPTWLLLQAVPEWRWGLEGDSSFWYPSMRLFRQKDRGNWAEVIERVAQALQDGSPPRSTGQPSAARENAARAAAASGSGEGAQARIQAPISLGELIDRITCLQIKAQPLQGSALQTVEEELRPLLATLESLDLQINPTLIQRLRDVNTGLIAIEHEVRQKQRNSDFGEDFIRLVRSDYQQKDRRAAIRKEINSLYGSSLVEEKIYPIGIHDHAAQGGAHRG